MGILIILGLMVFILGMIKYPRMIKWIGLCLMVAGVGGIGYLVFRFLAGPGQGTLEMFGMLVSGAFAFVIFLVGLFIWVPTSIIQSLMANPSSENGAAYKRGQSEARTALAQDKLGWKLCGPPLWHDTVFKKILREEYQVELFIIADDNVQIGLDQEIKGYNEVMAKAMLARFGQDIVSLAEKKAKQQFHDRSDRSD
jgi:hypothetical protein